MERQQEIEERSRDLIRKADEKERQELKRFKLRYGIFFGFSFSCASWMFFLCNMKIFAICSPPLQNN